MPANPSHAHHNILPLLDTQLALASALDAILQAEHQALLGSDLAALAALVQQKRSAAEELERSSAALHVFSGGAPQTLIAGLGDDASSRWQQLGSLATGLHAQNLRNGALLNERQNRLRWVAERASGDSHPLYSTRSASSLAASLGGRSLARA